jgi:ribonuclease/clavin/mitogillin
MPHQHPAPGIQRVPVRTPTLPPATHTNAYVVGEGRLSVFDPASPWEEEQKILWDALLERMNDGEVVERIVLTHHHPDHVGGVLALQRALRDRGTPVPVVSHPVTRKLLAGFIEVQEIWEDEQSKDCGGRLLTAYHTPGHDPGHLIFHDQVSATVIAGDMVAGVGTIALEPSEGDLGDYLASLERMQTLEANTLLPAHGPPLTPAHAVLSLYIAHRHQRSVQIRETLDQLGPKAPDELVPLIYPDLPDAVIPYAAAQITTHLRWLAQQGLAQPDGVRWSAS